MDEGVMEERKPVGWGCSHGEQECSVGGEEAPERRDLPDAAPVERTRAVRSLMCE